MPGYPIPKIKDLDPPDQNTLKEDPNGSKTICDRVSDNLRQSWPRLKQECIERQKNVETQAVDKIK